MFPNCFSLLRFFFPSGRYFIRESQMVQYAANNRIRDFLDGFGMMIKGWIGRKDRRARLQEEFKVFHMHQAQRGLAWNEDQFLSFLESDIRRAQQDVFTEPMGDPAQSSHRARDDYHRIDGIGAA